MTKATFIVPAIPTSFVYNNMKPVYDKGSGEARLFLGNKQEFQSICDFFGLVNNGEKTQQVKKYRVCFSKENCLDYMKYSKIEHVFQFFNKYKNTDKNEWESLFTKVKGLSEQDFYINLYTVNDSTRFYVRADEDIFMKYVRKMIVPKITDLLFVKDEDTKIIEIQLLINFSYDLNNNSSASGIIDNSTSEYCYFPNNVLLYGVPGCGKSYHVQEHFENQISNEQCKVRVVFHPDYTYTDFVGQLMPVKNRVEGKPDEIGYDFIPGPFTRIMQVAEENKTEKCLLIIEELNRGNAPAIFGEIFQLLDRDEDGSSKYAIYNSDIADKVYGNQFHPVKLPPNLTIVATMNTSDQNVFSMDTAFQRRWQMQHIRNVFTGEHADKLIEGTLITWKAFATTVNELLTEKSTMFGNSEDKCLGAYFAIDAELEDRQRFAEKVLKYLWDDAFKMEREIVFGKSFKSLSSVIESFEDATGDALKIVLKDEVYKAMLDKSTPAQVQAEEVADEEIIEQE